MKNRDLSYDILRSFCVLWIVCIWHLLAYKNADLPSLNAIVYNIHGEFITVGILGSFTLLSGLFLSKYTFCSGQDIINFYKKRTFRIYFLFLLSCVSFIIIGWIGFPLHFFTTITGLSALISWSPGTLWYIDMILIFYAITPIISRRKEKSYRISVSFLFQIVFLLGVVYGMADKRLAMYFPFFVIGLSMEPLQVKSLMSRYVYLVVPIPIIHAFLFLSSFSEFEYLFLQIIYVIPFFFILLYISIKIESLILQLRFGRGKTLFYFLSYSSMSVYLFHRPVYYYLSELSIPIIFWPIIAFIIAFCIQHIYDNVCAKLKL